MADLNFDIGDHVQVDGQGSATIIEKVHRGFGNFYMVELSGTDFQVEIEAERVSLIPVPPVQVPTTEQTTVPAERPLRFVPVAIDEINQFIDGHTNKNTLSKTAYDLKTLRAFLNQPDVCEFREIQDIPAQELSSILCRFFIAVRKPNGDNYEPNTLRCMMSSFDRQLRRYNYGEYMATGPNFAKVREVLKCKQKQLKQEGRGNLPCKTDAISDQEVNQLWETGQFGTSTPDAIIQTLWFYNTVQFGLRGCTEHRDMRWGDVTLKTSDNGKEYLAYNERQTKTRPGHNPKDVREVTPKLWANDRNKSRCPVNVYKIYASKRPLDYSSPDQPFYIATTTKALPSGNDQWFKRNAIGVNKLQGLMGRMVSRAGIVTDKHLSNHSARKYLVQKLTDNNVPPTHIMQISGHKNVSSINRYSHINENQHQQISSILQTGEQENIPPTPYAVSSHTHSELTHSTAVNTTSTGFQHIFGGAIHGGQFEIHIHQITQEPAKKRARVLSQSSDSE